MRILCRGLLDHGEETRFLLFSVDDEGAAEDLMATVLRVDLCETEDLTVGKRALQLLLDLMQVFNLLRTKCQTFLFVVFLQVLHVFDRLWLDVHGEDALVQTLIHALQHRIMVGILALHREIFLNARDALQVHVLCNLHSIGAPRGDHLTARSHKETWQLTALKQFRISIKPT